MSANLVSERAARVAPFHAMAILARARELEAAGQSIIHLEIGEPDFATPQPILDAGQRALSQRLTHYTPATGLPELRQAISDYYSRVFQVNIAAERILITPGSSGALNLVLSVLLDCGDQVLMPDPGYPCNRHLVRLLGGQDIAIPLGPETRFQVTVSDLEQHWGNQVKALMLASPSNPTGQTLPLKALGELYGFVTDRGAALIVDEIYQGLVYEGQAETALALTEDNLFVVNSFSKYFGMTGWRVGWLVVPEAYAATCDRVAQNSYLAAPTLAQHAALAALSEEVETILVSRREIFRERRDYLFDALQGLGFDLACRPEGAFYLYADASRHTEDSYDLASRLLEQAHVAVTPGRDFGDHHASRYLRFAYTTDIRDLEIAVKRLSVFLSAGG